MFACNIYFGFREEISKLFVAVRGLGPSSFNMSGSVCGIEGAQSLRRASSIRRTFTAGTAAIKRKSICLQVKFTVDGLIETLRRTKLRFIHCFLPQHSAGMCESRTALLSVRSHNGQIDDSLINVPLIRSQVCIIIYIPIKLLYRSAIHSFSMLIQLLVIIPS